MDTRRAAFVCYERRNASLQPLSPITQQQILLSHARRKKQQYLVKGDLHPTQINTQIMDGTSFPTLVQKTELIQFLKRNQSSKFVKNTKLLEPISKSKLTDIGDITPPLKLMRGGKPSIVRKMKAPELILSPPAIPLKKNISKMGRSIYSPGN